MDIKDLIDTIGADFYTGVPDSQLKALCNYLMYTYGIDARHHIIAANEGNCTALAAGYHLATGKVPVVYMQNSGEGNMINPLASLLQDRVYAIPVLFIIGWRGEPDIQDEPQHIYQGKVTLKLLEDMEVLYFVVDSQTRKEELEYAMHRFHRILEMGKSVAFVIKKGALTYKETIQYKNPYPLSREKIIRHIVEAAGTDPIISTTGKASRELFEIREQNHQSHQYDFLTVGSMGHSSSIALGVALQLKNTNVWCIDGDGALLMHMGAMAVIGSIKPDHLIHIVINNGAHETVGGMPTAAQDLDLAAIASACGYPQVATVQSMEDLDQELRRAKKGKKLSFIEVKCAIGSREELGRPTTSAIDNKRDFMDYIVQFREKED